MMSGMGIRALNQVFDGMEWERKLIKYAGNISLKDRVAKKKEIIKEKYKKLTKEGKKELIKEIKEAKKNKKESLTKRRNRKNEVLRKQEEGRKRNILEVNEKQNQRQVFMDCVWEVMDEWLAVSSRYPASLSSSSSSSSSSSLLVPMLVYVINGRKQIGYYGGGNTPPPPSYKGAYEVQRMVWAEVKQVEIYPQLKRELERVSDESTCDISHPSSYHYTNRQSKIYNYDPYREKVTFAKIKVQMKEGMTAKSWYPTGFGGDSGMMYGSSDHLAAEFDLMLQLKQNLWYRDNDDETEIRNKENDLLIHTSGNEWHSVRRMEADFPKVVIGWRQAFIVIKLRRYLCMDLIKLVLAYYTFVDIPSDND